jgi:hypothetical protein
LEAKLKLEREKKTEEVKPASKDAKREKLE